MQQLADPFFNIVPFVIVVVVNDYVDDVVFLFYFTKSTGHCLSSK